MFADVRGYTALTVATPPAEMAERITTLYRWAAAAARAGEIVLSDEAHRRVAAWLTEHGLETEREPLEVKGFDGPQAAWRLRASASKPA
jgi:class 3 adenylate cyclase